VINVFIERICLQVCISITLVTVETPKRPFGTMQKFVQDRHWSIISVSGVRG